MSFCGQCGFQIEVGAKFCPSCGQPCGQAAPLNKAALVKGSSLPRHEGVSSDELHRKKNKLIISISVGLVLLAVICWTIFFKPLSKYEYEAEVKNITISWVQSQEALYANMITNKNYDFAAATQNQKELEKYIKSSKKAMKQLSSLRAPKEYKTEDAAIKAFAKHYISVDLKRYKEGLDQVLTMKTETQYTQFLDKDNSSGVHCNIANKYFDALDNLGVNNDYGELGSLYFLVSP